MNSRSKRMDGAVIDAMMLDRNNDNIKKEMGVGHLFDIDYKWADSEEKLIDSPLDYGFGCLAEIENSIIDKN